MTFTITNIDTAAATFLQTLQQPFILALHGEMGAGKTTFSMALGKALGVTNSMSSPTYSIINTYETANGTKINHMDLYRLRDEEEAIGAGVEDTLYSNETCLVEWPEKAPAILPDNTIHVWLKVIDDTTRQLSLEG